jgi:hypothetical protein
LGRLIPWPSWPEWNACVGSGDVELVTKKEILDFQLPPRFEQVGDEHRKQMEDGKHRI